MKIRFSTAVQVALLAAIGVLIYDTVEHADEVMVFLKSRFARETHAPDAQKPAQAPPPAPLPVQIDACRKRGPGFLACMYDAGYAVNPAWSSAHQKDSRDGNDPARAGEVVGDQYRSEASPIYGVPYWVRRADKR